MSELPGQLDPLDVSATAEAQAQAAEAATHHAHRAHRLNRLKLSLFTSLLTRPISFLLPIVTIPLFLSYLGGKERYGLYEAIGAMAMYIGMTNAGLTLGLINRLTECEVDGDRDRARVYTSSITPALIVLMLLGLLILSVITPLVPWTRIFEVESPRAAAEIPWSFWLAGLLTLAGFLGGIPAAVYTAYQETHLNNLWDGAAKLASLVACFVVIWFPGLGIVGVIFAITGVQTIVRLINLVHLFYREKRFLMPRLDLYNFGVLRRMMTEGVLLFILQMSSVLLFQSDKLIIGIGLTPDDVASYAVLGRVFLTGYGVYMMLLNPLWPASGEAVRRGDVAWVRKSLRYSMVIGCTMMFVVGMVILLFGDRALRLFKSAEGMHVSASLICAVTANFVLRAWVDCRSIILNSIGVVVPQIVFYTGHTLLNLAVAIVAVRYWGVEGVAWSGPITALLTSAWGYPWMIRKYVVNRRLPARVQGFEVVVR